MSDDNIILILDGEATIQDLAKAASSFEGIVRGLSEDVEPDATVEWIVGDLGKGSIIIAGQGRSETAAGRHAISSVYSRWQQLAEDMNEGKLGEYPSSVQQAASTIHGMLNGRLKAARFARSGEEEVVVTPRPRVDEEVSLVAPSVKGRARGAIRGLVVSISNIHTLTITVVPPVWKVGVVCHIPDRYRAHMPEWWDHYVSVHGVIAREPGTGRPVRVSMVEHVEKLEPINPEAISDAAGCLPDIQRDSIGDAIERWWNG